MGSQRHFLTSSLLGERDAARCFGNGEWLVEGIWPRKKWQPSRGVAETKVLIVGSVFGDFSHRTTDRAMTTGVEGQNLWG
jgi:hypothetical protein